MQVPFVMDETGGGVAPQGVVVLLQQNARSTFQELRQVPISLVSPIAWRPHARQLASTVDDTTVVILDVDSGNILHRLEHGAKVREVAFTSDGSRLVTTTLESLEIWNVSAEQRVFTVLDSHTGLAVAADGRTVAAVTGPRVSLIELTNGFRHATLVTGGVDATCVAVSPDRNTLAVAVKSPSMIDLWDRRTGHEMMRLTSNAAYISGITFSPDGNDLLCCGMDANGTGGVWEWTIHPRRP